MTTRPEPPRPLLLAQNRKLRHLQGIYVRNLSFVRQPTRPTALDDAALNKSPAKLDALREGGGPEMPTSRSSDDLALRPGKPRRRSTTLAGVSPLTRQKKLQLTLESRVADAFFSLHCDDEHGDEPVYVSEVVERAANFDFQFFDLKTRSPTITRSPLLTVKLWTRRRGTWTLHLEEHVDLRGLSFLGTLLDRPFPANALVFHLVDGVYGLDMPGSRPPPPRPKQGPALPTSSYNALMKLSTLDNSIQDALATEATLTGQLETLLAETPIDTTPLARDRVALAEKYTAAERRALSATEKRRDELRASIARRREAMRVGTELQDRAAADVADATAKLATSQKLAAETREGIHGQRRRICADLAAIFRIEATAAGTLSFSICGVPLPNTDHDGGGGAGARSPREAAAKAATPVDEDALSAALGYVALLTHQLQYYLSTPLPYPLTPLGSRSWVRDDISNLADVGGGPGPHGSNGYASRKMQQQQQQQRQRAGNQTAAAARSRDFPLYLPRGGSTALEFRFRYAWFLLNKDIEALCAAQGLKVVDIRHTLPNLKYLLYVCSAGRDEMPERKRGGIRGLWAGRIRGRMMSPGPDAAVAGSETGSVGSSRGGSADGGDREELRRSLLAAEGEAKLGSRDGEILPAGLGLPFDEEETRLTLRTKGMREM